MIRSRIRPSGRPSARPSARSRTRPARRLPALETLEGRALMAVLPVDLSAPSLGSISGAGASYAPSINADGQLVAFLSGADDIAPNDTDNGVDAFVYARGTGSVALVSVGADGRAAGAYNSPPVLSADGRYVAFESAASTILPGISGDQVYLRDLATGTTSLLSVAADGHTPGNGESQFPVFSADGHHVVFESMATNLVAGATHGYGNVYERNLLTGVTTLVSASLDGKSDANSTTGAYSGGGLTGYAQYGVSADGRFVAFQSSSTNLTAINTQNIEQVYVRDTVAGSTTLVSVDPSGQAGGGGHNHLDGSGQVMSADGRYVVFNSNATNLVTPPATGGTNVFVRDLRAGTTALVGASAIDGHGVGGGGSEVLSPDGRRVAFVSGDPNVVALPTNGKVNVYARDLTTGALTLASVNASGGAGGNNNSGMGPFLDLPGGLSLSPDGRLLAFRSTATDLTPGVKTGNRNLYVRDLDAGATTLVTPNLARTDGGAGDADTTSSAAFSADGRTIAFEDTANDLVPGDNNRDQRGNPANDVFVRDLPAGAIALASVRSPLLPAAHTPMGTGSFTSVSADGRYVGFNSYVFGPPYSELAPGMTFEDPFSNLHAFVGNRQSGAVQAVDLDPAGKAIGGFDPVLTPDGRYVAFFGYTNLLPSGVAAADVHDLEVYLRDLRAGTTRLVSVAPDGAHDVPADGHELALSADGQIVAFSSSAAAPIPGVSDPNGYRAIYLRDLRAGTTTLVSHDPANDGQVRGSSSAVSMSADGRYVAFLSSDPGLSGPSASTQVFRFDRTTGAVALASVNAAGTGPGNNNGDYYQYPPAMTPDGRYVAFASYSTDLPAGVGAAAGSDNIFVRDFVAGTTTLVSRNAAGTGGGNSNSYAPTISADGTAVAFASNATDLAASPTLSRSTFVYLRNLTTNATALVSATAAGTPPTSGSDAIAPAISPDGRYVAFLSDEADLVPGYTSANRGAWDLYLRDVKQGLTRLVTASQSGATGGDADARSQPAAFSGDGGTLVFGSAADNLYPNDRNGTQNGGEDVFATATAGFGGISGTVFEDRNGNGTDDGEPGLPYWTVFLDANGNGRPDPGEESRLTDASGRYRFNDLPPGTYTLAILPQAGYSTTSAAGASRTVTVASDGQAVAGQDFGEAHPVPDLATSAVTVSPAAGAPGQPVTISWTVTNLGAGPANGGWDDALYLSPTPTLSPDATPFADMPHTGGLAPGASYTMTRAAGLPPVAPGTYYAIVQADRRNQVDEGGRGANKANNVAASAGTVTVSIPAITPGTPIRDSFGGPGDGRYYAISVDPGQTLHLALSSDATGGATELYVRRGSFPDPSDFDLSARVPNGANQALDVPTTAGGTYYIYAKAAYGDAAHASFTLSATLPTFTASTIDVATGGDTGRVTIPIHGALFTNATQARLVSGSTSIPAARVDVRDASTLYATFDLTGQPVGSYDLQLSDAGKAATLPGAFAIAPGRPGGVQVFLDVPGAIRAGGADGVVLSYVNTGNTDALAPLVAVSADHGLFHFADEPNLSVPTISVLGISPDGPASVLRPGERGQVVIPFRSTAAVGQDVHFSTVIADDSLAIDWASAKAALKMDHVPDDAWDAIYANFLANIGPSVGSYHAALAADATYLGDLGEPTPDVARLANFELNKAAGAFTTQTLATVTDASFPAPGLSLTFVRQFQQSIDGRFTVGPFGRGWTDNWQISAEADASGNVEIHDGGSVRFFALQRDGTYRAAGGDLARLVRAAGAFRLAEADGSVLAFRPDGLLDYEADAHGNRITAGYTGARLTSLTHSDGQALAIHYNAAGLTDSVTDPAGRVSTYSYDPTGQFLTDYTDKYGTTHYTYLTGQASPARNNALAQIAYSDNTHIVYDYDAQGRLITQHRDNNQEAVSYAYGAVGGFTLTDADGSATTYLIDDSGQVAQTRDALGRVARFTYDADHDLTGVAGPLGVSYAYTYDRDGNLAAATDPLGNVTHFAYDSSRHLIGYTDAKGNATKYGVDAAGDLLSITYADGAGQSFQYDPLGNRIASTNARGQAMQYQYDANGLLTKETFADNATILYQHDARGNLTQATDQSGGITTRKYDAADNLSEIDYPGGFFLKFSYNVVGQRTQSVDQTGFTVNYAYDALGRLSKLTDASGGLVASYTYDAAGRLTEKDLGNGTYTTYAYDIAGDLLSLVNHAPRPSAGADGPVNSRFDYAYDAAGRATSETTSDGQWAYSYDAAGQLTHAVFTPASGSTLAAQDLQYAHDAAGNRTQTVINGVTTPYTVNSRNEYTQVGGTAYTYDADGNLATATTAGATTTYAFDQLNRLTGISGASDTWSYGYDPFGNRVSTSHDGSTTRNLIDPAGLGNVAAQFDGSGGLIAHYAYGLGLVSQMTAAGAAGYYDFDQTGNTAGISAASGSYANRYSYLPFGATTALAASLPNPFTFVGEAGARADGSGLVLMGTRAYDTVTGRFLSDDPIGLAGGDPNVRRYAGNDPIDRVDPSGLCDPKKPDNSNRIPDLNDIFKILAPIGEALGDAGQAVKESFDKIGDWLTDPKLDPQNADYLHWLQTGQSELYPDANDVRDLDGRRIYPGNIAGAAGGHGDPPNAGGPGGDGGCACDCPPPPPPAPPGKGGPSGKSRSPGGFDPNELIGPSGLGDLNYVAAGQVFPYTIGLENDPKKATLAAQDVTITLPLDPNLDPSTFALGDIQFGSTTVSVPAGLQSFSTNVDATNVDGTPLRVAIRAGLDPSTGVVTWTFTSLDPATGQAPTNMVAGFLPVDDSTGRGQGFVHFTIRPRPGVAPDPTIREQATVVFDTNAPMATNVAVNGIDTTPPRSAVAPISALTTSPTFTVSWSGSDAGVGIDHYDVYASTDGGPFAPFRLGTTATSAPFAGAAGHSYRFYSVATDALGNAQAAPASAQAATQVVAASVVQFGVGSIAASSKDGTATVPLTRSGGLDRAVTVIVSSPGGRDVADFSTSITFAVGQSTASVVVPIRAEEAPGLPDDSVTLTLASADPTAPIGPRASATLTVRDAAVSAGGGGGGQATPPPLVRIDGGSIQTLRIGSGKRKKRVTALVLRFTGGVAASSASSPSAYGLVRAGRDRRFGTRDDKAIAIQAAMYDASRNTVALVPRGGRLSLSQPLQVQVSGLALRDLLGRPLDAGSDGQAGSNYRALVTRGGLFAASVRARRP